MKLRTSSYLSIRYLLKNNNLLLFFSFIGLLFISPVIDGNRQQAFSRTFFFSLIFIASVLAIRTQRKTMIVTAIFLTTFVWLDLFFWHEWGKINFTFILVFFYFSFILFKLIGQIIRIEKVSTEVMLEAVNIYLVIGLIAGIIFQSLNAYHPGSISMPAVEDTSFHDYIYFSFVSLTTLGYGDILPVAPIAKSFVIMLSITGQFYMAIVMAFLVSKYLNQKNNLLL